MLQPEDIPEGYICLNLQIQNNDVLSSQITHMHHHPIDEYHDWYNLASPHWSESLCCQRQAMRSGLE